MSNDDDAFGIWDEPVAGPSATSSASASAAIPAPSVETSTSSQSTGAIGLGNSSFGDEAIWGATVDEDEEEESGKATLVEASQSAPSKSAAAESSAAPTEGTKSTETGAEDGVNGFDGADDELGSDGFAEAEEGHADDFDDFGDFDESQAQGASFGFDDEEGEEEAMKQDGVRNQEKETGHPTTAQGAVTGALEQDWRPLSIKQDATAADLTPQIRQLLSEPLDQGNGTLSDPFPFHEGAASNLSEDQIRQVPGLAQVLVREESRQLWSKLTEEPKLQPLDWMRSRTRRQHLISLGVPINLDEVRPNDFNGGTSKALPPLSLSMDTAMGKSNSTAGGGGVGSNTGAAGSGVNSPVSMAAPRGASSSSSSTTTTATRHPRKEDKLGLGPKPEVDMARAKDLIALTEDQLTLQPLPSLQNMARELEQLTRQTSALLTYHLALREAHSADAEMYNGLIKDLVTGAANRISGGGGGGSGSAAASAGSSINRRSTPLGGGSIRRGASGPGQPSRSSTLPYQASNSGRNSPAPGRAGSPRNP